MDTPASYASHSQLSRKTNQNIQVYVRVRPLNTQERCLRLAEVVEVISPKEILTRLTPESKLTKKFTFDMVFGADSKQVDVYSTVVAPLVDEVLSGYNCTVFAYGQTGTGKTHTMVGNQCAELKSSWEEDSDIGIIPRALCHLFDELRLMKVEFSMRISYLELYNEELCDLLSSDESIKIRIYDDSTKKGSVIIQGLEEFPVHSKDDVYKLLEKGKERRKTAATLMNAQSSRSHTVFSILVHIKENGIDGEELLKIGKLNLVDLAGSENVSKAGNEKGIHVRETVNINQSLLTLGRVITALLKRMPHIPYRESKLTRLLQESLGGRTKTSIIATVSPNHRDIEETLNTLEYAHRAKKMQIKPEMNQRLTKKIMLKEYTEEIDKLKRDVIAARDNNRVYIAEETFAQIILKMDAQNRKINEKMLLLDALKEEVSSKEKIFNEVSLNLVEKTEQLNMIEGNLTRTTGDLMETKKILDSTKQRCIAKKSVFKSHLNTEQTLRDQASQILEVADVATQDDTEALFEIIDRPKNVEPKIQRNFGRFSERVSGNFETLENNMNMYKNTHLKHLNDVALEIGAITNSQSELLHNTKMRINDIGNLCDNFLGESGLLDELFGDTYNQFSNKNQILLLEALHELKKEEKKFKDQIKESLSSMNVYNEQQKSSLDFMNERVAETLTNNNTELENHMQKMNSTINEVKQKSLENVEELIKLTNKLYEEQILTEEERTLLEEFKKNIKIFKENHSKFGIYVSDAANNLNNNSQMAFNSAQGGVALNNEYINNQKSITEPDCSLAENLTSHIELAVGKSVAKCTAISMQLENMLRQTMEHTQQVFEGTTKFLNNFKDKTQRNVSDGKCFLDDNCAKIQINKEEVSLPTEDHFKILKNKLSNNNIALQKSMEEYAQLFNEHNNNCVSDLDSFKRNVFKTYAPTGSTPLTKEFSFPSRRTSPHTRVVNHFSQENDWTDSDTSVHIDETSDDDVEDRIIFIQPMFDTEIVDNSPSK